MRGIWRATAERRRGDQGLQPAERPITGDGVATSTNERGAVLILALVYIIIVSVVVAVLTTWATNDLNNTTKFTSARSMDYAASSAVQVAMNSIRYYPNTMISNTLNVSPPSYCWGTGPSSTLTTKSFGFSTAIAVWCSTAEQLGSSNTRTVKFYACLSTVSATSCATAPLLNAVVVFDDYPQGGGTPLSGQCATYCGEGATWEAWDWGSLAGSVTGPSANSISVTSTPPPHVTLNVTTYTPVASATSGDTVVVTSTTTSVCTVTASPPYVVSFITNGTCTIDFNDAGNVNYYPAGQVQQSFSVGLLTNTITVNSSPPANASVGGVTYTPAASATSGDSVAVTSATISVCTVASGVVTFIAVGTCTINFNDPGNSTYVAATQVQQSMTVTVGTPAGADIEGVASPQDGVLDNGDSIDYIYNQTMSPSSFLSGFTGSSMAVYVQLTRSQGQSTNLVVCSSSGCGTQVNLGAVSLGDPSGNRYMSSGGTAVFNATMLMSTVGGESVVTVTLAGTPTGSTVSALVPANTMTTLTWVPSASAKSSSSGLACSTGQVTEATSPKLNF